MAIMYDFLTQRYYQLLTTQQVIQKLIERVPAERLGFVQAFRGNVFDLSTHPYGCRVLQRTFEHLPEEQTRPLLDELHKYAINLMQDQFGVGYIVFWVGSDSLRYNLFSPTRITSCNLSWSMVLCRIVP